MYDLSGGCDREHTCGECKYFEAVVRKSRFGKEAKYGVCYKHPLRVPEWKESFMACKWWKSPYSKTIVKNSEGQCEGQMDLDMFL